jgi:hypothetical protein
MATKTSESLHAIPVFKYSNSNAAARYKRHFIKPTHKIQMIDQLSTKCQHLEQALLLVFLPFPLLSICSVILSLFVTSVVVVTL